MIQMISLSIRQLQSHYVRRLANQCYVRYWINWDGKNGSRMALRCLDQNGEQVHVPDLLKAGFLLEERDGSQYYVCERSERPGNWESRETVSPDIALTSTSPEICACCDSNDALYAHLSGVLMTNGVVERCDGCERFGSDEEAREAFAQKQAEIKQSLNLNLTPGQQELLPIAGLLVLGVTTVNGSEIIRFLVKGSNPFIPTRQVNFQELNALIEARLPTTI